MIDVVADLILLVFKIILISCTALVAVGCVYAWGVRHWDAFTLRRRSKAIHESAARRRSTSAADRIVETRAAGDRDHPLHSLGERFR